MSEKTPVETHLPSYRCHPYPSEIIVQCARLYFRFLRSRHGIEELMFEQGVFEQRGVPHRRSST